MESRTGRDQMGIVGWGDHGDRPSASSIQMAEFVGEILKGIGGKFVLVKEDVIVSWTRRSLKSGMALEVYEGKKRDEKLIRHSRVADLLLSL